MRNFINYEASVVVTYRILTDAHVIKKLLCFDSSWINVVVTYRILTGEHVI